MVDILSAYSNAQTAYQTNISRLINIGNERTNAQHHSSEKRDVVNDVVEFSADAQKLAQAQEAKNTHYDATVSYYEEFRPTREGFSAHNLALGIVDPGAQPFSQNRSFEEVSQAARENLDSKYQQMQEEGEPFDENSLEAKDTYSLFGELDRRALYAVSSNEGGLFTKQEQEAAQYLMHGQVNMASGLYSGPTRLMGKFKVTSPTTNNDPMHVNKATIQYLDQVSDEEKATSIEWARERAMAQWAYEITSQDSWYIPENLGTDHPLANLLYASWKSNPGSRYAGQIHDKKELLNEPWFKDQSASLDKAIQQTRELYGL